MTELILGESNRGSIYGTEAIRELISPCMKLTDTLFRKSRCQQFKHVT